MTYDLIFDVILSLTLISLCWRVLTATNLFKAVVLFIVYGMLMALAWVRLQAPDIALAEAAIGSGLTGALMLDAVGQISGRSRRSSGSESSSDRTTDGEAEHAEP